MCGIVGIFGPRGIVEEKALAAATRSLAHRGPDGEGLWLSEDHRAGLGHRRLSIVDTDNGHQPLFDSSGTIGIVVNGEFYGDADIRSKLEAKGYRFKTRSDSEILIYLYQEYGLGFIQHLRGEFAFILYDARNKRMVAGRDRFGIKPLCYHIAKDGALYLASEAKALFAAGLVPEWDMDAFMHASCFQYIDPGQTMFKAVHQLPPGHLLIQDSGEVKLSAYWDMDYPAEGKESPLHDITLSLQKQVEDAVHSRLRSDSARICCHLSGGIDSASIAAIASRHYGRPLPCFTVTFPHALYDEGAVAERMAKHIGAEFHPVDVGASNMVSVLSDAVFHSEGLAINSHLAAKFILNREIRKAGYNVALSGEGSDELFAGYPHLKQDHLGSAYHEIARDNPVASGVQISGDETLPLGAVEKQLGFIPAFMRAKAAIGLKIHALLEDGFRSRIDAAGILSRVVSQHNAQLQGRSRINQSSYLWTKYALGGYILRTLGDGCEMAHGIEGRVPFLDHKLFEFAKQIPPDLKIKNGIEKNILREAMKKYVTPEIAARRKHPFMAPPLSLLSETKGWQFLNDHIGSEAFGAQSFYDARKVKTWLKGIRGQSVQEQIAAEPVIMIVLTSLLLADRYRL